MIDLDNLSILIVDDMESMRKSIRSMLKLLTIGKRVRLASNGQEGWDTINETMIDLVIIDWNMPVMNGLELLVKIRESKEYRNMPVIMITAEAVKEFVSEAAESDIDGYLLKPLSPEALEEKVKNVIHFANNPTKSTIYIQKARELEEEGQLVEAIEMVKLAIAERNDVSRYFRKLGQLYLKKENDGIAEKCFIKAVAINDNDALTRYMLSEFYIKKNSLINAIKYYDQAVNISPRKIGAGVELGEILIAQGMRTEAMAIFQKVVGYSKKKLVDCERIAELCIQDGDYAYAKQLLKSIIDDNPDRIDLRIKLAILHEKTGNTEKAIIDLNEINMETNDLNAKLLLSRIYIRMKKPLVADRYLNEILIIDPAHEVAAELRRQI